jgi:hypothetical protein
MKRGPDILFWIALLCSVFLAPNVHAQQGGQDYWQWTGRSLEVPSATVSRKCITISSSAIYVGTLNSNSKCTTLEQYTLAGAFTKKWPVAFTDVDGLASDSAGNVYAFDKGASKVRVFDSGGTQIRSFGSAGAGDGQFSTTSGYMVHAIAVDDAQNTYVADWGNKRIQVFDSSGVFRLKFGSQGDLPGQFKNGPAAVVATKTGETIAYDSELAWYHLSRFSADGKFLNRSTPLTGFTYPLQNYPYLQSSTLYGYGGDRVFSLSQDALLMVGVEENPNVYISTKGGLSRVFEARSLLCSKSCSVTTQA